MPRRPRDQDLLDKFGERVAKVRATAALSQQKLADRLGVRPEAISQIESGKLSPTLSTVVALARGMGVKPSVLLDFEEVAMPNPAGPEEAELLAGSRRLSAPEQQALNVLVRVRTSPT